MPKFPNQRNMADIITIITNSNHHHHHLLGCPTYHSSCSQFLVLFFKNWRQRTRTFQELDSLRLLCVVQENLEVLLWNWRPFSTLVLWQILRPAFLSPMCYNCGCQHHLAPLLSITPLSMCIQDIGITPCIVVPKIFVPSDVPVSSNLFLWGKLHPLSILSCCKFWIKYQKSNHREISLLDVLESEDFCRFNKEFHMKSTSNWLLPRHPLKHIFFQNHYHKI